MPLSPPRMSFVLVLSASVLWSSGASADDDVAESPTHVETDPIRLDLGPDGKLETIAMDRAGNLLAGISRPEEGRKPAGAGLSRLFGGDGGPREYAIKVVSPEGRVVATWTLGDLAPKMIHGRDDGVTFVGGRGKLSLVSEKGEIEKTVALADVLDGQYADAHVSGVTANDEYVFVAFGHGWSLRATEDVVRFDRDLGSPKLIVEKQFGCCSHIDLQTIGEELLVAENSRHRVNRFSFDGEKLGTWGRRDRKSLVGFAACCNPVNFDLASDGVLYTAESGVGRVKRYSADGKYLGLVGYVDTTKFDRGSRLAAMSCYIPVEVSADRERIYVMDVRQHFVRVLVPSSEGAE